MKSPAQRLMSKTITKPNGCVEWIGGHQEEGYGRIRFLGKKIGTHRLSWILSNGEIPEGLLVLHRCDNPRCVNSSHLFLGTHAENTADKVAKDRQYKNVIDSSKTHCPQGHPYSEENTYRWRNTRRCKTCSSEASKRRYRASIINPTPVKAGE